ncbi:hypothetical protein GOP47_0010554 [Adiantum capillus-veneris]|uniref:Uncharacterized protein n=1 Tax=Adiantum capillus-veneris TaxID=13818 RepID=A0A9D4UV45_ADICA|nr:hypothetical protein GOP47_0010554 [Adiantum capillus-veneris]
MSMQTSTIKEYGPDMITFSLELVRLLTQNWVMVTSVVYIILYGSLPGLELRTSAACNRPRDKEKPQSGHHRFSLTKGSFPISFLLPFPSSCMWDSTTWAVVRSKKKKRLQDFI